MLRRRALLAAAATLAAGLAQGAVATAAHATTTVTTVDVPTAERWEPRQATHLSVGDTAFSYSLETTPGLDVDGSATHSRLHSFSGDDQALDKDATLIGDRLVLLEGNPVSTVSTRLLSDTAWTDIAVPTGAYLLGTTADGLVLDVAQTGGGLDQAALMPWDGGAPVVIAALDTFAPSPWEFSCVAARCLSSHAADAHGLLIVGYVTGEPAVAYVDTTAVSGWVLPSPTGSEYGLGSDVIAWRSYPTAGGAEIQTVQRPAGAAGLGTVSTRPYPAVFASPTASNSLLPLGDDVVVSADPEYTYSRADNLPAIAVASDGTMRTVLSWGHDLAPDGIGGAYAVTGNTPDNAAIVHLDAGTYAEQAVVPLDPMPARVDGVALDGTRLVTVDSSDHYGAVVQREIGGSPDAPTISAPDELASNAANRCTNAYWPAPDPLCTPVVADSGTTVFTRYDGSWHVVVVDNAGTEQTLPDSTWMSSFRGLDGGRWLAALSSDGDMVYDVTRDSVQKQFSSPYTTGAVTDGVIYRADEFEPGGVWMQDVATGSSGVVPLPSGCQQAFSEQVAGSWVLVRCSSAGVVDQAAYNLRDGRQVSLGADGQQLWLGDGYAVQRAGDGSLSWVDFNDATSGWQPLGTAATTGRSDVAVSRTGAAGVAWVDTEGVAHAVLLPATPSGIAPRPDGPATTPAAVTGVTATPRDGQVTLGWNSPPAQDEVRHYLITGPGNRRFTVDAPATQTLAAVGLPDGVPATFTVSAVNLAGVSIPTSVTATPLHDAPPSPTNVQVHVDQATSTASVTWDYSDDSAHQPARGFNVYPANNFPGVGLPLPVTARSFSFQVPVKGSYQVIVSAVGDYGAAQSTDETSYAFPGIDTTVPVVGVTAGPAGGYLTRSDATFSFAEYDPDDTSETLTTRCSLDNGPATSCTSPVTYADLSDGRHHLVINATDRAGHTGTASATWVVDTMAPRVDAALPQMFITGRGLREKWNASDAGSGILTYDLRWRQGVAGGQLGSWQYPANWQRIASLATIDTDVPIGGTACYEARARDRVGHVSAWSRPNCETRFLDDRALTRVTAGWWQRRQVGSYLGTVTTAWTYGARLTRASTAARRVAVLVTRCPGCGQVGIYVGRIHVGTINLAAKTTQRRVLLELAFTTVRAGAVSLRAMTSGKRVEIDGLAISPV